MMKRDFSWAEWLRASLPLQIVAILLGVGTWVFVNSGRDADVKQVVKLQYSKIPAGLVFEKTPVKEASIGMSGPLYRLRSIREEDLTILIDLSSARPGPNRVELTLDALKLPFDLEAAGPYPRSIVVYLEPVISRSVPIRPVYEGNPAEGSTLVGVRMNPEVVSVVGPRSVLSKLESIPIHVPLAGKSSSFSMKLKPEISVPETVTEESVIIDVEISAVQMTKEFENVPVFATTGREVSIQPAQGSVVVEGSEKEIRSLQWQPKILVDVGGLDRGRYRLRGRVELPPGLRSLNIEPQNFLVEVIK